MSTIVFIFACFIVVLIIASKIPGVEHLVRPVIDLVFYFIQAIAENGGAWIIWFVKSLLKAHQVLFINLTQDAEEIDPTSKIS